MLRIPIFFVASLLPCVYPILKGIDPIISPDLLHALASMGHGDLLVLADANFPSSSVAAANGAKLIHADGHSVSDLLKGILKLVPLDTQVEEPAFVMDVTEKDKNAGMENPPVWDSFKKILSQAEGRTIKVQKVERENFYERAKKAFAVVSTGETALYGNLIIKFGVVAPKKNGKYSKKM